MRGILKRISPPVLLSMVFLQFCPYDVFLEEPPPQAVEIHAEQPERLEEPPVEAQRFPWANEAGECIVTYYCVCSVCCGKEDGITASGAAAVPYETCAVDPEVIPLGSTVMLEFDGGETHTYRAEDTGVSCAGREKGLVLCGGF